MSAVDDFLGEQNAEVKPTPAASAPTIDAFLGEEAAKDDILRSTMLEATQALKNHAQAINKIALMPQSAARSKETSPNALLRECLDAFRAGSEADRNAILGALRQNMWLIKAISEVLSKEPTPKQELWEFTVIARDDEGRIKRLEAKQV